MTQTRSKFPLGRIVATRGAVAALQAAGQHPHEFLTLHSQGDWGDLLEEDRYENELSLREGFRILSAYHTKLGDTVWIITECHRSATTILLPSEYSAPHSMFITGGIHNDTGNAHSHRETNPLSHSRL